MRFFRLVRVSLLAAGMATLMGCGGGGSGGDGEDSTGGIAWIEIGSSGLTRATEITSPAAMLSGRAFVSGNYERHNCAGLACLLTLYDDSFPGVEVRWTNETTGRTGSAVSRYGTLTNLMHRWSARVPVISGINQLRVSATDPAGNTASASVEVEYIPPAPMDLRADTGDGRITLLWSPVPLAAGYRIYWSATQGEAFAFGNSADVSEPPWVHRGLSNGSTYYYVVTSLSAISESKPSSEIAAIAGAASRPTNLKARLFGTDVELTWDDVPTATGYTIYWQNETEITRRTANAIPGVSSPYLHTGLSGLPYYYVVTATNGLGESLESEKVRVSPPLPPPPPTGLTAVQHGGWLTVRLGWQAVPGVDGYVLERCQAPATSTPDGCAPSENDCGGSWQWETVESTSVNGTFDEDVESLAYWYRVTASNEWGSGQPSDWAGLCLP